MRHLLVVLSVVPHLYVAAVGWGEAGPSGFLVGVLLWNLAPVALGAWIAATRFAHQGIGWLLAIFVSSTWALWIGLLSPKGSTGALIFLFLPVWNLALVGPIGAVLGTVWSRYVSRSARVA